MGAGGWHEKYNGFGQLHIERDLMVFLKSH